MFKRFLRAIFFSLFVLASARSEEFLMQQRWDNLLMVHWIVPVEQLRKYVPEELEILTFKGKAYVGAVALDMVSGNFIGFGDIVSEIPLYRSFGQLNLRTYVRHRGKTGVHFFTIFANHRTTVATGNLIFGLPYDYAKIVRSFDYVTRDFKVEDDGFQIYKAHAVTNYVIKKFSKDSLEHFLTEHTLYFQVKKTAFKTCVHTGELWHKPWELAQVNVPTKQLNYFRVKGMHLDMKPLTTGLYSHGIDVLFYAPKKTCYQNH